MNFEPKWIAWESTPRCNLSCIHCRSSSTLNTRRSEFSEEEAKNLIDDIREHFNPTFVLTGGEPLLRGDIFEIAEHGRKKGMRVCIATNGTLVNNDICNKIIESGIKIVSLSLDGNKRETHDDFRKQKGSFDGAISAAKLFRKYNIPFIINSSFTKRNMGEIEGTYKLAKELGAVAWYMFLILPTGRGKDISSELIEMQDYERILKWHYNLEKKEREMIIRPTCAPQYYRIIKEESKREGIEFKRQNLSFGTGGSKGCVAGQYICLITSTGDVNPCSYFPISCGNVKKTKFKDIWDNSSVLKDLRDFKEYERRCGVCKYLSVCGGCRARSYFENNNYMDEDPICAYQPPVKISV